MFELLTKNARFHCRTNQVRLRWNVSTRFGCSWFSFQFHKPRVQISGWMIEMSIHAMESANDITIAMYGMKIRHKIPGFIQVNRPKQIFISCSLCTFNIQPYYEWIAERDVFSMRCTYVVNDCVVVRARPADHNFHCHSYLCINSQWFRLWAILIEFATR